MLKLAAILASFSVVAPPAPLSVPRPPPPEPAPQLPEGRLLLVSGTPQNAAFLVKDSVKRTGEVFDLWIYAAYSADFQRRTGAAHEMSREQIDCSARTHTTQVVFAYDEAGEMKIWLPAEPTEAIRPRHRLEFFAKVLCDNIKLPDVNEMVGYETAFSRAREMLSTPGVPALLQGVP